MEREIIVVGISNVDYLANPEDDKQIIEAFRKIHGVFNVSPEEFKNMLQSLTESVRMTTEEIRKVAQSLSKIKHLKEFDNEKRYSINVNTVNPYHRSYKGNRKWQN